MNGIKMNLTVPLVQLQDRVEDGVAYTEVVLMLSTENFKLTLKPLPDSSFKQQVTWLENCPSHLFSPLTKMLNEEASLDLNIEAFVEKI
jgi:hypothetical protein